MGLDTMLVCTGIGEVLRIRVDKMWKCKVLGCWILMV